MTDGCAKAFLSRLERLEAEVAQLRHDETTAAETDTVARLQRETTAALVRQQHRDAMRAERWQQRLGFHPIHLVFAASLALGAVLGGLLVWTAP